MTTTSSRTSATVMNHLSNAFAYRIPPPHCPVAPLSLPGVVEVAEADDDELEDADLEGVESGELEDVRVEGVEDDELEDDELEDAGGVDGPTATTGRLLPS